MKAVGICGSDVHYVKVRALRKRKTVWIYAGSFAALLGTPLLCSAS